MYAYMCIRVEDTITYPMHPTNGRSDLLRVIIVIMQMVYHYANAAHDSLFGCWPFVVAAVVPAVDETSFSGAKV